MADLITYHGDSKVIGRICELINSMTGVSFRKVQTLPQTGESNVIYLVPKSTSETDNVFDEYIWIDNDWELIGDTEIDLSDYYTKTETDDLLDEKADIGDIPTDFVPKSTGGTFDGNVNIIRANSGTSYVNSVISLGNNIPNGTLGNTRGVLQLFDQNGKYSNLIPSDNANSRNIYLPKDKPNNSELAIVGDYVDWDSKSKLGAKNLFPFPYYHPNLNESYNQRNIIYTQENGVIIPSGTCDNTGNSYCQIIRYIGQNPTTVFNTRPLELKKGKYKLTGGVSDKVWLNLSYYPKTDTSANPTRTAIGDDTGSGLEFTVTEQMEECYFTSFVQVARNYQIQGEKVKPMITVIDDTDEWEKHSKTNRQLTDDKAETYALGTIETLGKASSKAYSVGQYFIDSESGALWKVTSAISSGATIIRGTNCAKTTLLDELYTALH